MAMTSQDDLKRVKRVPVTEEFISLLLENPQNYYIDSGIPEGSNFRQMYKVHEKDCTYIEFQNDNWEPVEVGQKVPILDVELREKFCSRCDTEMMYDEDEQNQYCPKCERMFRCEV
jgi:NADH pyrophosphatase NudC (nudix superfamily)